MKKWKMMLLQAAFLYSHVHLLLSWIFFFRSLTLSIIRYIESYSMHFKRKIIVVSCDKRDRIEAMNSHANLLEVLLFLFSGMIDSISFSVFLVSEFSINSKLLFYW